MDKAKMSLLGLSIPPNRITNTRNASRMETLFELHANLKVSAGSSSGDGIDALELEWIETCDWFEFTSDGWIFKGTKPDNTDVHALHPQSQTFMNWHTVRYLFASFNELGNNPPAGLKDAVAKAQFKTSAQDLAAKHWIAKNGCEWTLPLAVDRPGIGLNPDAGSGGGAGGSLVTTNSRRRVLYFDLGFKGSEPRVTATLILESVNGKPTLQKFLVPGITREQANDETNLANWRQELT